MTNPKALIKESRKEIRQLMQTNIARISGSIISEIMTKFKKSTDSQKINATKKIQDPSGLKYKLELREALAVVAREAINQAKQEVPSTIKFAEFDNLPPELKRFLEARAQLYVAAQLGDVKSKIQFAYQEAITKTDSIEQVQDSLNVAATAYVEGPAVAGGAGKIAAEAVNQSRKKYFSEPEVDEQIEAVQYVNTVPVSDICKDLAGHVFRKDDPDLDNFTPPFHFNCDGWLRPILVGNLRGREPKKYVPTKKAQEAIQFSEECACLSGDTFNHSSIKLKE